MTSLTKSYKVWVLLLVLPTSMSGCARSCPTLVTAWTTARQAPLSMGFSSILAWGIPWTEEPAGLQSTGSQRAGHDLSTKGQGEMRNEVATTGDVQVTMNVSRGLNQRRGFCEN